jgi:hypothetical protein
MHSVRVAPRMAVLLGLLVAVGVTGCKSNSAPANAAPVISQNSQSASAQASPSAVTSSTAPASSGGIQNLPVTTAVRSGLLAAYAAAKNIPVADVAGSVPGSIYYAYDPATGTYWAMAAYEPLSSDSLTVRVGFQDGASDAFYRKAGSASWQVTLGGAPVICGELRFFPASVLEAWSLPTTATPASMC